jgi:hypothetical protein
MRSHVKGGFSYKNPKELTEVWFNFHTLLRGKTMYDITGKKWEKYDVSAHERKRLMSEDFELKLDKLDKHMEFIALGKDPYWIVRDKANWKDGEPMFTIPVYKDSEL